MPKWQIVGKGIKMAKAPKSVSPKVNLSLLGSVIAAAAMNQTYYVAKDADSMALVTAGYIEVNTAMVNEKGDAAARPTDAGRALVVPKPIVANGGAASPYAIIANALPPPGKPRGNAKGGGAPTLYPFETMEIGQSFFVPVSEKHSNPVKTLGSTVSSANMRFAEKTGETKTIQRSKRGARNKLVLDDQGNKIMETVTLPVYRHTRKFIIREVAVGTVYGGWTAEANGALITRVELPTQE